MIKFIAPIREQDRHGSGSFGASRGNRKHQGIDCSCLPGSKILAVSAGKVSKIGFPYHPKNTNKAHFRYVEVTDSNNIQVRYFYVNPSVKLGDKIGVDGVLGTAQDLDVVYPGITQHVHFEVKYKGAFLNPINYLRGIKC